MRKFNVGDKVRIIADKTGDYTYSIGKVGVIDLVSEAVHHYPYKVVWGEDYDDSVWCDEDELDDKLVAFSSDLEGALTGGWGDDYYIGETCVNSVLLDVLRDKRPGDVVHIHIELLRKEVE